MKIHIQEHLGDRPHKCDFCSYSSSRRSNLKLHLKKHVKDPDLLPAHISNVKICQYCNVSCPNNRALLEHWEQCIMVPVSSKKVCLYCNKFVPSDIDVFIGHCQTCPNMSFLNAAIPQSCKHCSNYASSDVSSILEHCQTCPYMNRPEPQEYRYVCVSCDYYTLIAQNMRNHTLIHLGDRQFKCCLCTYGAFQKDKLMAHIKSKHSTKVQN
uniref:RE1-silencing transcription factor n=1 Tax=Cacopsylla melanoneura TaxID=428564 RepID=A0A8D9DZY4_9HEMI